MLNAFFFIAKVAFYVGIKRRLIEWSWGTPSFRPLVSSSVVRQDDALIVHTAHRRAFCTSVGAEDRCIMEGLQCSHFLDKEAENLEFPLNPINGMSLKRASAHVVFYHVKSEGLLTFKCSSFLKCFQVSNSYIQHLPHFYFAGCRGYKDKPEPVPTLEDISMQEKTWTDDPFQPREAAWWSGKSLLSGLRLRV